MFRSISEIWRGDAWIQRPSLQKETEPIRRVFYTRANRAGVGILQIRFSVAVGNVWLWFAWIIIATYNEYHDRMIIYGQGWQTVGGAYESRSHVDWRSGSLVSAWMIICAEAERGTPASWGAYTRQPFWLISQFTRHRLALCSLLAHQRSGDTPWESQEMLGHSAAVITQRYLHGLT